MSRNVPAIDPLANGPASDPLAPPSPEPFRENAQEVYRLMLDGDDDNDKNDSIPINTTDINDTSSNNCHVLLGAVANLCSATLGAGVLSLPFAFSQAGLLCSLLLLSSAAAATSYSIHILAKSCEYYQLYTYESLVQHVLTSPKLRTTVELCIVLFCEGCAVAYCIAVRDILQQLRPHQNSKLELALVWSLAMLPLSLLPSMRSLQCSSAVGMASIGTLVFAAAVHWFEDCCEKHHAPDDDSNSTNTTNITFILLQEQQQHPVDWSSLLWPAHGLQSVLTACPIILFAFSCQVNVCAIYQELPVTTGPHHKLSLMQRVTQTAVGLCATLYLAISCIGLADFQVVQPNLLNNYAQPLTGIMQGTCVCVCMRENLLERRCCGSFGQHTHTQRGFLDSARIVCVCLYDTRQSSQRVVVSPHNSRGRRHGRRGYHGLSSEHFPCSPHLVASLESTHYYYYYYSRNTTKSK